MNYQPIYEFSDLNIEQTVCGPLNRNLALLEDELGFKISVVAGKVYAEENADVTFLQKVLDVMARLAQNNMPVKEREIITVIGMLRNHDYEQVCEFVDKKYPIVTTYEGRTIYAKTMNQKLYLDLLNQKDVIFATGSAGTGKTWVAVGFAINELKKNRIKRLVITRPAVEAGEKLGFLPGDLKEKVDPYLIPIYDAIYEFLGREHAEKMIEKGIIEIAPLAYMRGRTLDNAIIILDEGQNTTRNQMLMALTRLGFNSKMIVTGDITQIDLPKTSMSGLVEAVRLLSGIKQIGLIHFDKSDVMRHPIVTRIIAKYEELDNDQD